MFAFRTATVRASCKRKATIKVLPRVTPIRFLGVHVGYGADPEEMIRTLEHFAEQLQLICKEHPESCEKE